MAALSRPTKATYEIHEKVTVDTADNEDHTFCGIMFPVKCKDLLPLDHLVIKSVAVRGRLGPLTVWVSNLEDNHIVEDNRNNDNNNNRQSSSTVEHRFRIHPRYWTKVYEKVHTPSFRKYQELVLTNPIKLLPGQVRAIYIHSSLPSDEAIVYDNSYYGIRNDKRYDDSKLSILTGRAHVSTQVFGQEPIWGWGNAWRDRREFVGRLEYGTVYKLWNPQHHFNYGNKFQLGTCALFMCQRRWESPWSMLPDECIFYILNMCRWDWFEDDSSDMKVRRKKEKLKLKQKRLVQLQAAEQRKIQKQVQQQQEQQLQQQQQVAAVAAAVIATNAVAMEQEEEIVAAATATATATHTGGRAGVCTRSHTCNRKSTGEEEEDDDHHMTNIDEMEQDNEEDEMKRSSIDVEIEELEEEDDDDDDDEEEEWQEPDDDDEDDDDDDDDDDDAWSDDEYQYQRANERAFTYRDIDSDEDEDDDDDDDDNNNDPPLHGGNARRNWIRSQFARIHVLRGLASMEDRHVQY